MVSLALQQVTGKLPTSIFDLVSDGKIVGMVQVRHKASAGLGVPEQCASHIYYQVNEADRGHGYGKEALRLALGEAKKLGLPLAVVTCDENNFASKRIIEVNGGSYTKSCVCEDGSELLRYEFHFSR